MPLFPVKDRTIRLTLENRSPSGIPQATNASQPRFISQFIPNSGLLGGIVANTPLGGVNKTLDLVGPTSIDINYSSDVGAEPGLFTSFLQPWFIKPVNITISGTSYIGAYSGMARVDRDAKGILERFMKAQNDFSDLGGNPGTSQRILIEFTGMPRGMSRFLGYITSLSIKEGIDRAYLLGYTMSFIGRNNNEASTRRGREGATDSHQRAGN
jgi:hypothetical protein